MGNRVEDVTSAQVHRVEGVFAALDELLEQHRSRGARRSGGEGFCEGRLVVDAVGVFGPGPGRGFDDEREAEFPRPGAGGRQIRGEAVAGAGHPALAQDVLHARLVPEAEGGLDRHAADAELLTHPSHGHLQLLEDANEGIDAAPEARGEGLDPAGELSRVKAVLDPLDALQLRSQAGGQAFPRFLGDDAPANVVGSQGAPQEAQRALQRKRNDEHGALHAPECSDLATRKRWPGGTNPPRLRALAGGAGRLVGLTVGAR